VIYRISCFVVITLLLLTGCDKANEKKVTFPLRSFQNTVGTVYTPLPIKIFTAPTVTEIKFTVPKNVDAIWGATGRDDSGHIYFGASSQSGDYGSAFLYQYNPETGDVIEQSDVVAELKRNQVYRQGMRQNKLHSKFYQANDGYLYFSSFDEGGEAKGINPTWGGNLWRKLPDDTHWQHLLATEEALIGINTNGRYVYALGYWDHALYQFDTETEKIKKVTVGSTNQHVSRNFIVDEIGHAYVPQLIKNDFNEVEVSLAEYNEELKLVANYPLPSYQSADFEHHHGIVAYTSMKNGNIYFTSADGGLYQVKPFDKSATKVQYKGMMHPDGEAYIASLFAIDGTGILAGIGRQSVKGGDRGYEWIIFNTNLNQAMTTKIELDSVDKPLLYGTLTRDNKGDMYLVGRQKALTEGYEPLLLNLSID
jgi:hypothetical protein